MTPTTTRRFGNNSNIDKLRQAIKDSQNKFKRDERFWKPTPDAHGVTTVIMRFLPTEAIQEAHPAEDMPWVKYYRHVFDGPGGKYFENCRSTIGQADPVMDHNRDLWASGNDSLKQVVRKQSRQHRFIRNILIIDDKGNPANNGRVFLYNYPKQIHEKIQQFLDEDNGDAFNVYGEDVKDDKGQILKPGGANFKFRQKKKSDFPSYEDSSFAGKSSLFEGDDDKIGVVLTQVFPLQPFVAEDQFKRYDVLQKRLNDVLRLNVAPTAIPATPSTQDSRPPRTAKTAPAPVPAGVIHDVDDEVEEDEVPF